MYATVRMAQLLTGVAVSMQNENGRVAKKLWVLSHVDVHTDGAGSSSLL